MLEIADTEMNPMPTRTLFSGLTAKTDFFVRLRPGGYVKIIQKGQEFDLDRVRRYEDQDLQYVYVRRGDLITHVASCTTTMRAVFGNPRVPFTVKYHAACRTAEAVYFELDALGLNTDTYAHLADLGECMTGLSADQQELTRCWMETAAIDHRLGRMGMATSLLALATLVHLGWLSGSRKTLTVMAGLLHDIGLLKLTSELRWKDPEQMDDDERQEYQQHPITGSQMVAQISNGPPDLARIVLEHHERPDGKGFPNGLSNGQILPLSRLISLADEIADLSLRENSPYRAKPLREVLVYVQNRQDRGYPDDFVAALAKALR